jgi:WD40 repeat protein
MLTWQAHTGAVTSLAFVPGGGLLSTGADGYFKSWDSTTGAESLRHKFCEPDSAPVAADLMQVLVDSTGRHAVVGLQNKGFQWIELPDGILGRRFHFHPLSSLSRSPDGGSIFANGRGYAASAQMRALEPDTRVWQIGFAEGEVIAHSQTRPGGSRYILAINPDASQVIAGSTRFAWPSGKIAGPIINLCGSAFAVSPDGDKLFGVNGSRLLVWGFQVGALRHKLKGHIAPITGLTSTPDGRKLWTASLDATVRQWDVETYRCEKCYGLKIGPLGCIAVSSDGLTAAAGSAHNGQIAVWDLD